ncbi:MAG: YceI family protein [Microscillaceae bacterium]|nr:YceI family protein [Microscillaceae bacterium]
MKALYCISILLVSMMTTTTGKYQTQTGDVGLIFDLTLGEMKASTDKATSTLDFSAEEVHFSMEVNSFRFENPLLEKQFKEVYMESDKYPKTTFIGKFKQVIDFNSPKAQAVEVNGTLQMHGISKSRTIPAVITVKEGKLHVRSEFLVKASDHGINIPSVFFTSGKDEIKVVLDADYVKM